MLIFLIKNGCLVVQVPGVGATLLTLAFKKIFFAVEKKGSVVVAQLVERLLPTPEICGSHPDIGKDISTKLYI